MSHHEHKHHIDYKANIRILAAALFITLLIMFVEFFGGLISGSLALLSDAGHMLTDTLALSLALFALWFSRKPATEEKTFGFYRFEILSALLNGAALIVISLLIFYQAIQRMINPQEIRSAIMLVIAVIGFFANLAGVLVLSKGSKHNLNVRGAFWHIVSDTLSSVGVIIGGIIIYFSGFYVVDSIIGFAIGLLILRGALELVIESVDILLEATPKDIKLNEVMKTAKEIEGVKEIHDLHIWTITSGLRACCAHVLIDDVLVSKCSEVSDKLKHLLSEKYNIDHATLQFECDACPEGLVCGLEKHK